LTPSLPVYHCGKATCSTSQEERRLSSAPCQQFQCTWRLRCACPRGRSTALTSSVELSFGVVPHWSLVAVARLLRLSIDHATLVAWGWQTYGGRGWLFRCTGRGFAGRISSGLGRRCRIPMNGRWCISSKPPLSPTWVVVSQRYSGWTTGSKGLVSVAWHPRCSRPFQRGEEA
jgi:hypothetical protein